MKINKEIIEKLNPCKDRFDNFTDNYPDFDGNLKDFLSLENIIYSDKIWVVTKLFTKEQNLKFAIKCSSSILHLFEEKYPEDKRPRLALEAAKTYLANPTEENKQTASAAADAAAYAADAAYAANAYAASAAAYAAANAANAAYASASAAYAAANAVYAADAAAEDKQTIVEEQWDYYDNLLNLDKYAEEMIN